ncbi:MAG: efflux RND transporter periplasmic adaptor subunit [Sphingobacterium sp.]|jgi:membrane fusion protein (multidrug efflux system)|nr:efflux RND transporter periplasmic adaptor subunit [Sphingobacterium sp.]
MKKSLIIKLRIGYFLFTASMAAMVSACGSGDGQSAMMEMPPQETDFVSLNEGTASFIESYPGKIEGSVNVDIKAQVSGYLETIYVKEGDYVQKGQNLFRIKGDVFNEQIKNSEASLKSALASQTTARIEMNKLKPLVDGKVISEIQLQEAQAKYDMATAQVAQAKAALGSSTLNANFALIKAPVSGYIGRIPNRIGNLVTPTDAMPLTTLAEIDQVFVYFSLSEADYLARKTASGNEIISLITADGNMYPYKGKLEAASGNVDQNTGSMTLKAVFPNPEKNLRNGGFARIEITKNLNNVIAIPKGSIKDIQDKYFVFKLADSNKVSMSEIGISGSSGNFFIMKSGLKPGDKIAINRIDGLVEGMLVAPKIVSLDSIRN